MNDTGTDGFETQDLKQKNIDPASLDQLKDKMGSYEALFNKRAIKFRSEGHNQQQLEDEAYRTLILNEYTFLKRPVYVIGADVFVGNSKKTVKAIKAKLSE